MRVLVLKPITAAVLGLALASTAGAQTQSQITQAQTQAPKTQARTASSGSAPNSLAAASHFFKAPPLDGCTVTLEDLVGGGSQALRGRWELQKGGGERALTAGSRVGMVPMASQSSGTVSLDFRNGRLVADSPALGYFPLGVTDRAAPEPGSGLRAGSAGRGDLPEDQEVFLDEIAMAPLPCGPEQMLQVHLQKDVPSGSGEGVRHDYRLFLIDQSRMSGTYRISSPGGRMERGLISLVRR